MSSKIRISLYLALLLIFCFTCQVRSAEGNSNDGDDELRKHVKETRLLKWAELNSVISFDDVEEFLCLTEKLLLAAYTYMKYFLQFLLLFQSQELLIEVSIFLRMEKFLDTNVRAYRSCHLVRISRVNEITNFVEKAINSDLHKELEFYSKKGYLYLIKYILINSKSFTTWITNTVYYLMILFESTSDSQLEMLCTYIVETFYAYISNFKEAVEKLGSMSEEEIVIIASKVLKSDRIFTSSTQPYNFETIERLLIVQTRNKKLEIAKKIASSGGKAEDLMPKCEISDREVFSVETMLLISILIFEFCIKCWSTFDEEMTMLLVKTQEVKSSLLKQIIFKGTELDLEESDVVELRKEVTVKFNLSKLKNSNAIFGLSKFHGNNKELKSDFNVMLEIFSSCVKLIDKKMKKLEKVAYLSNLYGILKDFLKEGLKLFSKFVTDLNLGKKILRTDYETESESSDGEASGAVGGKRKDKKKRRKGEKGKKASEQTSKEIEKKKSKREMKLEYLLSRQLTLGSEESSQVQTKESSPPSKQEKEPEKDNKSKVNRKETRIKKLLQAEEKSEQREKVKKVIQEQKSSNVSSKKSKQDVRKATKEANRYKLELERIDEREREREKEKARQERIEHSNFMYKLKNSIDSIEGMFNEAEKMTGDLSALIKFVYSIISEETTEENQSKAIIISEKSAISSVSVVSSSTSTAIPMSRVGSFRRRADEVPTAGSRPPTERFFQGRVGAIARQGSGSSSRIGSTSPSRDGRGHQRGRTETNLRDDSVSGAGAGAGAGAGVGAEPLAFDGFVFNESPFQGDQESSSSGESKFLKFFSESKKETEISAIKTKNDLKIIYCLIEDTSFSSITESSSESEINKALETCGVEIQRLYVEVLPIMSGPEIFSLKLVLKDLIRAFVRMLLLLQQDTQQS